MSLDSRHARVRLRPSLHFVTPPRALGESRKNEAFPYQEFSARRRLFPPRHTVHPVLTLPNAEPKSTLSPIELGSAPSPRFADVDNHLGDNGSSCSSGSMKILGLSTLDLSSDDTSFDLEASPSKGVMSSRCPNIGVSMLLEKIPGGIFPESGGSVLEDYLCGLNENGVSPSEISSVGAFAIPEKKTLDNDLEPQCWVMEDFLCEPNASGSVPMPPAADKQACLVPLPDSTRCESQASVLTARLTPATESTLTTESACVPDSTLVARSEINVKDTIHEVKSWDSAITICTSASTFKDEKILVQHHVQMTVIVPKVYIAAERVRLSIMVSNGLQAGHVRHLETGHSSLSFEEDPPLHGFVSPKDQEIIVSRDTCDLELPLQLYFSFAYPSQRNHCIVATVPTFRPHQGMTLSEIVFIDKPSLPLTLKPLARDHLSGWKTRASSASHATRFERVDVPRLYPEGFRDDVRIMIIDPSPVCFESLSELQPCDVVRNLDVTVEEVLDGQLECDLSFNLEVGHQNPVVTLDAHGWRPKYFVIDGRLVTEQTQAWRENEQGYMALLEQEGMAKGPIRVETHWQEPESIRLFNEGCMKDLPLPRITDLRVVGGRLTCKVDKRVLALSYSGASSGTYAFSKGPHARLPDMYPGYEMYLSHATHDSHLPLGTLLEDIKPIGCPSAEPSISSESGYDADSEKSLTVADDELSSEGSHSNPLFTLLFPLWLIFILLINVEPMFERVPNTDCTVSGHCGLRQVEPPVGWKAVVNTSLIALPSDITETVAPDDGIDEGYEPTTPQNDDESKRAVWEIVRDWIDYGFGWEEWQGYA